MKSPSKETMGEGLAVPPDYPATRDYLYSLKHHGAKYGIDRMRLLAAALGHPERQFPLIHVAGTNGKGSVCAMLEAIFRAAGYRTGLYTSPHLVRQGERVQVNREILSEAEIIAYTSRLRPVAEALGREHPDDHPSFFEFMTAMAFLRFAEAKVDIGVIETGLGGRLDATNVVEPELSIITSIGLDHTEQLGARIELIAAEKAGIIKPGRPVLVGELPPEAHTVIAQIAAERGAPLHLVSEIFPDSTALPETNLTGEYQRRNAALAVAAVRLLKERFPIPEKVMHSALKTIHWPGRWDVREVAGRTVIFDASHNAEAAVYLDKNLKQLREQTGKRPSIVAGILGETRARALLPVIAAHAETIYLVAPQQQRANTVDELKQWIPADFDGKVKASTVAALFPGRAECTVGPEGGTVVVTGSLYLIGEIMEQLSYGAALGQSILQDTP